MVSVGFFKYLFLEITAHSHSSTEWEMEEHTSKPQVVSRGLSLLSSEIQ